MSEIEEINRKITHVQGPQGQTVVIVPPKKETTDEETNLCISYCCVAITIMLGSICFVLGTVYGAIMLSIKIEHDEVNSIHQKMIKAAIWLLAIAAFFVIITCCIFRSMSHMRKKRRRRFMYRDGSGIQRIPTTNTEEDNEGGFVIRSEVPHGTSNTVQDQGLFGSQGYGAAPQDYWRRQSPSPAVMRQDIPPEQRRVPRSDHRSQFYQPRRPYTDAMYHETASHSLSSPVTERSFSPASDTTYLSHYSTRS